jgi:hypothetical protein
MVPQTLPRWFTKVCTQIQIPSLKLFKMRILLKITNTNQLLQPPLPHLLKLHAQTPRMTTHPLMTYQRIAALMPVPSMTKHHFSLNCKLLPNKINLTVVLRNSIESENQSSKRKLKLVAVPSVFVSVARSTITSSRPRSFATTATKFMMQL